MTDSNISRSSSIGDEGSLESLRDSRDIAPSTLSTAASFHGAAQQQNRYDQETLDAITSLKGMLIFLSEQDLFKPEQKNN